ncbi:hemophore-related protein [Mycobacterium lehmannii]|uniref:hemophore-related protein n=1 Tax=Mycobacterium lehmannii TaxID=2048550 RepID=UPI0018E943F4
MIKAKSTLLGLFLAVSLSSLVAGGGTASAQPDYGPLINTTCTYDQALAAVHAENPIAAQYLDSSPPNLEFLRMFLAASPEGRANLIRQVENNPGAAEAFPVIQQMFASCHKY